MLPYMLHNMYWYASLFQILPNEYLWKKTLEFHIGQLALIKASIDSQICEYYVLLEFVDMHL